MYILNYVYIQQVIKVVDMNGAAEYFPKLWSDMIIFEHTERANNVAAILSGMVRNKPQPSSDLTNRFAEIAWDAWEKLEGSEDEEKYRRFR